MNSDKGETLQSANAAEDELERALQQESSEKGTNDENNISDVLQGLGLSTPNGIEVPRHTAGRLILDSNTLQPIWPCRAPNPYKDASQPFHSFLSFPSHSLDENPRLQCLPSTFPAYSPGIYNFSPHRGPAGCKLLIYLRHTSILSAKLLNSLQTCHPCFWVDFNSQRFPAVPHVYRVHVDNSWVEWETLSCLVPARRADSVRVRLFIDNEYGGTQNEVEMGIFEYDDTGS